MALRRAIAFVISRVAFALVALLLPLVSASAELTSCSSTWAPLIRRGLHGYAKGEGYSEYARRVNRKSCAKKWTILVYMAADNDLAPYAYWDLYEMESAGSSLRADLVVQLDTPGPGGLRRFHIFQDSKPYDSTLDKRHFDAMSESDIRSPVVEVLPEGSESEARRFRDFLAWGMREYPSEHTMVIVWGHGQGWAPARREKPVKSRFFAPGDVGPFVVPGGDAPIENPFAGRNFGGIAFNESRGTFLDIPSIKKALRAVSKSSGRSIDVYASDACLMQMAEVATELSSETRFIVGSTQVQNFLGLPYRTLMYELNTGRFAGERAKTGSTSASADEPYLMARMIPKVFRSSMAPNGLQGRMAPDGIRSVTMSSISSSELRFAMLPALERLSGAIEAYLAEDPLRAIDVQFVLQTAPTFMGGAQELGAFINLMKLLVRNEAERTRVLSPAAARLDSDLEWARKALERTVISYALGTRYSGQEGQLHLLGFRALSVWLPVSEKDWENRVADLSQSEFYRSVKGWARWLKAVFRG